MDQNYFISQPINQNYCTFSQNLHDNTKSNYYNQNHPNILNINHPLKPINPLENNTKNILQENDLKNSPSSYISLYLNEDILKIILNEINGGNKQFTEDELHCFIAILYLSGYMEVPRRRMLWERSPDTHNSLVASAMQRDRFEAMFTALYVNLNLETLINCLNQKFLQYSPNDKEQSVGEITLKAGMKVWCGCNKTGYCSFFTNSSSPSQNIILDFTHRLIKLNLISELCFEDVHSNQNLHFELNRVGVIPVPISRGKSNSFNHSLGGVDKLGGNLNLYAINMKNKKPQSQLFSFILDVILCNSYLLYKTQIGDGKCLDLLNFRRNIVIYYLQRYGKPIGSSKGGKNIGGKIKKVRLDPGDARFDGIRHYVIPQIKQTRCGRCTMKTTTRCQKCDVGVHVKCFIEFHTRHKNETNCK